MQEGFPMNIILTNDDGVHAQGLQTLHQSLLKGEHQVTIVAPSSQRSAASRSFTLHFPYDLKTLSPNIFATGGTPANCVMLALELNRHPDVILSGVNHGANVGADTEYSGTVGAALEGAKHGIPAFSLSLAALDPSPALLAQCGLLADRWIEAGIVLATTPGTVVNINFPAVSAISTARLAVLELASHGYYDNVPVVSADGTQVEVVQHASSESFAQGTDGWGIKAGYITLSVLVSQHASGLTQRAEMRLREWVEKWNSAMGVL
ncbi:MAG: 5'/3'-nucleotidase SurE [Sulfobacillus benefaciens]|uniref:5'-nucleotidase SurE n=1 Tax=Sulfobacillus benefaciens TaxID=453960 RepID=A0A2T2X900_9FIRM|nr:MAG: 5'/3'-nucleotidase SurE [Sulfobacillus benefaciens]